MAKCEKREIVPEPPPVEYVLTLTKAEAETVGAALYQFVSLGVEPDALAIVTALHEVGVDYAHRRRLKVI